MRLTLAGLIIFVLMVLGCSSGNPSIPDNTVATANGSIGQSVMGVYDLHIDTSTMTAELSPKRINSIGESYIVSGLSFFTNLPCSDCMKLESLRFNSGNLILTFNIEHPFEPGSDVSPPSATNRLDLDVFDVAAVIIPVNLGVESTEFIHHAVTAYPGYIANAAGYTRDLANVIDLTEFDTAAALPYVLVVDDSLDDPIVNDHFNEFPMGSATTFDIAFSLTPGGEGIDFELYLTMGYGFSARKSERLEPSYFNPEFNRKAAWKINVITGDPWISNDSTTARDLTIEVYDWQQGATVNENLENPTDVWAESSVASVSAEILGMNDAIQEAVVDPTGDGTPESPLVYTISIINQNLLAPGTYYGLVKVTDSRTPLTAAEGRDYLIHTPDGVDLPAYDIPEFATYQIFDAIVNAP